MLQKRQSSRCFGKDSLLCDGRRAHADERADRGINKPGRVVVAVAAPGPVDEDDVLDLAAPAVEAEIMRERAEPGPALLLELRRDRVVTGRDGAGSRRVREDVHLRDPGALDGAQRRLECGV